MAAVAPYIAAVTPADSASGVSRAAVFRIQLVDRGDVGDLGLDLATLNVAVNGTDVYINGALQAGAWNDSFYDSWDDGDSKVVELSIQNTALLAHNTLYEVEVSVDDIGGNSASKTLSYTTRANPEYDGSTPTPLETAMGEAFSNAAVETFRVALLARLCSDPADGAYEALAARRGRQIVYRERFEGCMTLAWPDETSVYAGPIKSSVPAQTMLAERARVVQLTRTALRSTAHIVPEVYVQLIEDSLDRSTRPLLAHAAAVTLLGIFCALREVGRFN